MATFLLSEWSVPFLCPCSFRAGCIPQVQKYIGWHTEYPKNKGTPSHASHDETPSIYVTKNPRPSIIHQALEDGVTSIINSAARQDVLAVHSVIVFFLLPVTFLVGRCVCQLLLPDLVGCLLVQVGEEDVKHLRVPPHRVTLDVLLDVLNND